MFSANSFQGKKVAVFGLARSGISCALSLKRGGAVVLAWDDSDPAVEKARIDGVPIADLHNVDFKDISALVLSPGVSLTHPAPHWTVVKARAANIEIISDTELFAREAKIAGSKIVAITGTNGKSTTTALIGHVLKSAGLNVAVGGNIGLAVFSLPAPKSDMIYVLELSSFQIDLMPQLKPFIGILINLSPDHLDRHGTMENYAAVKARMFARQDEGDTAIIGVDDEWSTAIADTIRPTVDLVRISVAKGEPGGIDVIDGILTDHRGSQYVTFDLRPFPALQGRHNWQNAAIAYAAACALKLSTDLIERGLLSFPGLAHRMQRIGSCGRVEFVNDSKATNADAAEKAIATFKNIYWIAGGIAKSGGIEPLVPLFSHIAKSYLIGVAAEEFAKTLEGKVPYELCGNLGAAVVAAAKDAAQDAISATVLLSPACASFDHYKNFEVRGQAFVDAVAKLPGVVMFEGVHE